MNVAHNNAMRPSVTLGTSAKTGIVEGLLDGALQSLGSACAAFASLDGATASGVFSEGSDEDREDFNIAVSSMREALRSIRSAMSEKDGSRADDAPASSKRKADTDADRDDGRERAVTQRTDDLFASLQDEIEGLHACLQQLVRLAAKTPNAEAAARISRFGDEHYVKAMVHRRDLLGEVLTNHRVLRSDEMI